MAKIRKIRTVDVLLILFAIASMQSVAQKASHKPFSGMSISQLEDQFTSRGAQLRYSVLFDRYKLDQKTRNSFNNVECELGEWKIRIDLTDPSNGQNAICTVCSMKSGKVVLRHKLPSTLWRDTINDIVAQDLNGDGYPDIIITNTVMGTQYLASLNYMTLLLFTQNEVYPLEVSTFGPSLGSWRKVNEDGKAEFICESIEQRDYRSTRANWEIDRRTYVVFNVFAFQGSFRLINVTSSFKFINTCFISRWNEKYRPIKWDKLPKDLQYLVRLPLPIAYKEMLE